MHSTVEQGRAAYGRRDWDDAYLAFSQARAQAALAADDVERLALSAGLTGRAEAAVEAFAELYQLRLDDGDVQRAARAAFWAAMRLFSLGEMARGGGWIGRAQRLVADNDCVECGYLRLPLIFRLTASGDYAGARAAASAAAEIGTRFADGDLTALARTFEGRALIRLGCLADGLPLLDEAMVAATQSELSPLVAGLVYCNVIAACQQSYALDRAREWTAALSLWCNAQPQLVPFAGACHIHRSEVLQLSGNWAEAVVEAKRASERLGDTNDVDAGNARYQQAELHRLRGEHALAEQVYAAASERGRDPQPGLSLLRLAQGRIDAAAASMGRVLSAASDALTRARFLPAHVEIMLAAGKLDEARSSARELGTIADQFAMEIITAIALHAHGTVTLAEGDAQGAIAPLRRAQAIWDRAGAPYPSARIRVVVAKGFAALGDHDGAALELSAAKKVFTELGALPDIAAIDALTTTPPTAVVTKRAEAEHNLSAREREVLLLVASGETNRAIAGRLFLSEKTIDRHVSNIFVKISVSTRAAATAWAYENGLVG